MRRYDEALATIDASADGEGRLGPNELLEKRRLLDVPAAMTMPGRSLRKARNWGANCRDSPIWTARRSSVSTGCAASSPPARMCLVPRAGIRADVPQPIFILVLPSLRHRTGRANLFRPIPKIAAGDEPPARSTKITAIMPRIYGVATPEYAVRLDRAHYDPKPDSRE